MKRRTKTIIPTKIEANNYRIYKADDIHDIVGLIFPRKNACNFRGAFILIFLSIKCSRDCRISSPELKTSEKKEVHPTKAYFVS